jgi:exodeoxyribonuclease VII small subunit
MTKKHDFEDALSRLEQLVTELEGGEVKLDDMLKKYQEGAELVKFCFEKLEKAEKQVQKLSGDAASGFELEPVDDAQ